MNLERSTGRHPAAAQGFLPILARRVVTLAAVLIASIVGTVSASPDGVWSQFDIIEDRWQHLMVYDSVNERAFIYGGNSYALEGGVNETWVWDRNASPSLIKRNAIDPGDPIGLLGGSSAIFDPLRQRVVLFGGNDGTLRNAVWALPSTGNGPWARLTTAGTPPAPRSGHKAIYDSARDRMIVFGPASGTFAGEVWALSMSGIPTWTQLAPLGTPPSPGSGDWFAAYDAPADRAIVTLGNSVFQLSFAGSADQPLWTTLAVSGAPPASRYGSDRAFEAAQRRIVVYGGSEMSTGETVDEVSFLALAGAPTWTKNPAVTGQPTSRYLHAVAVDEARHKLLCWGGLNIAPDYGSDTPLAGIHELDLSGPLAWHTLRGDKLSPPRGTNDVGVYDSIRDRFVVAGENSGGTYSTIGYKAALSLVGDFSWEPIDPTVPNSGVGIFDPRWDGLVTFGGYSYWSHSSMGGPSGQSFSGQPSWYGMLGPALAPSHSRRIAADLLRNRILMFGGDYGFPGNNVYTASLEAPHAGELLAPTGTPPSARLAALTVYDPVRDQLLVFGGSAGSTLVNETWALSLAGTPQWTQLAPAGTSPPAGYYYFGAYDPVRDRLVVYTTVGAWALSLAGTPTWSQLSPSGTLPVAMNWDIATTYDPRRDRMLFQLSRTNGINGSYAVSETWALTWGEPAAPSVVCASTGSTWTAGQSLAGSYTLGNGLGSQRAIGWKLEANRNWPGMPQYGTALVDGGSTLDVPASVPVPDSAASGIVRLRLTSWYAGAQGNNAVCERYIGNAVTSAPLAGHAGLALAIQAPRPNPARDFHLAFSLPDARDATLEVFDLGGRRVVHRALTGMTPGRHEVAVEGARLPAGIYLVRLQQGKHSVSTRAAIMR